MQSYFCFNLTFVTILSNFSSRLCNYNRWVEVNGIYTTNMYTINLHSFLFFWSRKLNTQYNTAANWNTLYFFMNNLKPHKQLKMDLVTMILFKNYLFFFFLFFILLGRVINKLICRWNNIYISSNVPGNFQRCLKLTLIKNK